MVQSWIFTFGVASPYSGYVVKINGSYEAARKVMVMMHGNKWCWQYEAGEAQELIDEYGYKLLIEVDANKYVWEGDI